MKKIRGDSPSELMDATNANLHFFAKQVRRGVQQPCCGGKLILALLVHFCLPLFVHAPPAQPAPLQGLRTLVLGTKIISPQEYAEWDKRYQEVAASFEGRDENLEKLGIEIEQGLELIGVTAIEDKLQVGPVLLCCSMADLRLIACGSEPTSVL
jgi:hypothetical protein